MRRSNAWSSRPICQDVASCDFIIENVTEDWALKKSVYENLDRVAPTEICLGPIRRASRSRKSPARPRVRPMWWASTS